MKYVCPQCDHIYNEDIGVCLNDDSDLLPYEDASDLIGKVIEGRFEIQKLLGEGGMGSVYLAHQRSVDRQVCIKVLKREVQQDPTVVKRFLLEAKASSRLTNAHTITIYDFGRAKDGLLYIAMEYLHGRSLREKLAKTPTLSVQEAVRIMSAVGKSLAEAHEHNIIHRDLKPDNIFLAQRLDEPEFVKVLDFGIARAQSFMGETKLTKTGIIQGTPTYMSPESVLGKDVDARSDIYALGIMMYEMIAGVAPFRADTPMQVLMRHVNTEAEAITKVNPRVEVPRSIHAFIWRCIAKDVDERPSDGRVFRAQLTAAYEEASASGAEFMKPIFTTSEGFRVGKEALQAVTTKKAELTPDALDTKAAPKIPSSTPAEAGNVLTPSVMYYERTSYLPWILLGLLILTALGGTALFLLSRISTDGGPTKAHVATTADEPAGNQGAGAESVSPPVGGDVAISVAPAPDVSGPVEVAAPSLAVAPEVTEEPAAESFVSITIVARPRGAKVFVKGEEVGETPWMGSIKKADESLGVFLKKAGYQDERFDLVPNQDRMVDKTLKRVHRKKQVAPKTSATKAPSKPAVAPVKVAPKAATNTRSRRYLLDAAPGNKVPATKPSAKTKVDFLP